MLLVFWHNNEYTPQHFCLLPALTVLVKLMWITPVVQQQHLDKPDASLKQTNTELKYATGFHA